MSEPNAARAAMLIDREGIRARIPHGAGMCLLDGVLAWDTDSIRCSASSHRDPGNPLRREGRLSAIAGIEYAAQAIALHGALTAATHEPPRIGLLGSIRDARCHAATLDCCDEPLVIEAHRLLADGARMIYQFTVSCAQQPLLDGRAAIALAGPVPGTAASA